MKKSTSGFTLVELLIAIVVIAILAAISVVAYSGIQERAHASNAASIAAQISKLIDMYYIDHGRYPASESDADPSSGETCVGKPSDYPAGDGFEEGECLYNTAGGWTISVSSQLTSDLEAYGTIPNASIDTVLYSNEYWRGIRYLSNTAGTGGWIEWVVKGNYSGSCGPDAQGSYYSWVNATKCLHGFGVYAHY